MTKEEKRVLSGIRIMAGIAAVGFGIWVKDVGAGIFAWAMLSVLFAKMVREDCD